MLAPEKPVLSVQGEVEEELEDITFDPRVEERLCWFAELVLFFTSLILCDYATVFESVKAGFVLACLRLSGFFVICARLHLLELGAKSIWVVLLLGGGGGYICNLYIIHRCITRHLNKLINHLPVHHISISTVIFEIHRLCVLKEVILVKILFRICHYLHF